MILKLFKKNPAINALKIFTNIIYFSIKYLYLEFDNGHQCTFLFVKVALIFLKYPFAFAGLRKVSDTTLV